jgi:hypothetical protein
MLRNIERAPGLVEAADSALAAKTVPRRGCTARDVSLIPMQYSAR